MTPRTRKLLKILQTAGVVCMGVAAVGFGAGSASGMTVLTSVRWLMAGAAAYAAGRFLLWYLDDKT